MSMVVSLETLGQEVYRIDAPTQRIVPAYIRAKVDDLVAEQATQATMNKETGGKHGNVGWWFVLEFPLSLDALLHLALPVPNETQAGQTNQTDKIGQIHQTGETDETNYAILLPGATLWQRLNHECVTYEPVAQRGNEDEKAREHEMWVLTTVTLSDDVLAEIDAAQGDDTAICVMRYIVR